MGDGIRSLWPLVLALALCGGRVEALDPLRAPSQYVLTKWGAAHLPSSGVHAIAQTPDHYLWLGTNTGLLRFDGARFVGIDARTTPAFGDGGITSMAVGPDGTLYLGATSGAIGSYRGGTFTPFSDRPGSSIVCTLLAARNGTVWFSLVGRPVYRWSPGRGVRSLSRDLQSLGPLAITEDASGAIWIGTHRDGLAQVAGDKLVRHPITHDTIQALRFDRNGALWIGTPHGLLRMSGGKLDRFARADGLADDSVSAILEDQNGSLWVGSAGGGLSRRTAAGWSRFTRAEGLSDDDVRSLLEDHEGNLWVGTADGLNCMSEARFTSYGRLEGLGGHAISAVAPGRANTVWAGTSAGGVIRIRPGGVDRFDLPGRLGREIVISMLESRTGGLWVSLDNGRLFELQAGTFRERSPHEVPRSWRATVISEDDLGPLFYVTGIGLARFADGAMQHVSPEAPRVGYTHAIYRDRAGTLWLGSSEGLFKIRDGIAKRFSTHEGLPRNRVRAISEDEDGSLWLATAGGLVHLRGDTVETLTVAQGLPENYIRLVLDDRNGHLWVSSAGHIFRLDKRDVASVFSGRAQRVDPVEFDASDGLRTTETVLSNNPGFRAPDGRLWFATSRGVSVIDPAQISVDEPAPSVRIERFNVDGHSGLTSASAPVEFGPGRGQVTVEYAALSFRAPGRVHFRYRLDGFDDGWVDVGVRRSAYYSNLPPGAYRFTVEACNRDGRWNGHTSQVPFVIRPPYYRTHIFYALCAAAALGLFYAAYQIRVRQMRSRFAAIIGERTRIARELHDTLAQGLAGTGIQLDTALTMLPGEPEAARDYVALARAMVRSTLAEVRRSIWVLRAQTSKGRDGLSSTLPMSLRQLTDHSALEPVVHVSGPARELPAELERNLLRIAHEAVTNAVRHSGADTLEVDLDFAVDGLHLRVRDDGRGFDPEPWLVKRRGDRFGLVGISERVKGMGGALSVKSRPGEGTEIGCRLPYNCRMSSPEGEEPDTSSTDERALGA